MRPEENTLLRERIAELEAELEKMREEEDAKKVRQVYREIFERNLRSSKAWGVTIDSVDKVDLVRSAWEQASEDTLQEVKDSGVDIAIYEKMRRIQLLIDNMRAKLEKWEEAVN